MNIKQLVLGAIESNCYIIWNDQKEALVIDPGAEPKRILNFIDEYGLKVVAYPATHGHYDHISFLKKIYDKHPAPVGLHPEDECWAFESPYNQYPPFYPLPERPDEIERHWQDGQVWHDAGFTYKVLHTPGHSPGCVCFYFEKEKVLISGDTLFKGSIGRVDLPGGNARDMTASLRSLKVLPDEVKVYPGHGAITNMGAEKKGNAFLSTV